MSEDLKNPKEAKRHELEIPDAKYWTEIIQLSVIREYGDEEVRERAFYTVGGIVLYGLCVAELPDSFLVGLPASFTKDEVGHYVVHQAVPHQVTRLLKTSVSMVGFCTPMLREIYFKYLMTLPEECDLLSDKRREYLLKEITKKADQFQLRVQEEYKKPETFEEVPAFMKGYSTVKH